MSMYVEQIRQLAILQQVDSEIIAQEEILTESPKKIAALKDELAKKQVRRDELQERIDIVTEQKGKMESEIETDADRIKKSKNKLMMVENTKEYHAMMREMDTLEKNNRLREEERTTLLEDLEELGYKMSDLQKEIESLESDISTQQASLDSEMAAVERKLKDLRKKKKAAGALIPAPILSRYAFIRGRLDNPVIVSVSEGICNGCHIKIPPQYYIELQKGEQILNCPNCQRIIFWEQHYPAGDDVAAEKK